MTFKKTSEHEVIEAHLLQRKNLLVNSGPGTGKSTCIEKLIIPAIRGKLKLQGAGQCITFNSANANELKERIKDATIDCATTCATGNRLYKKAYPMAKVVVKSDANPKFRKKASEDKMVYLVDQHFQKELADGIGFEVAIHLVSHAKKAAFGLPNHPSIDDRDAWKVLAKRYLANAIEEQGLDAEETEKISESLDQQITYGIKLMKLSNADNLRVNFDDQIYLPLLLNVELPPLDFIIYDEFQDVKPVELEYLRRYHTKGTLLVGVGDYRQFAYEFAGAIYKAFETVQEVLNMTVCEMKISWRCSHTAARLANTVFPDSVIPAEGNKVGVESILPYADLFNRVGELDASHGLLSRSHKNLMPAALKLLAARKQFWYKGVRQLVKKMNQMIWHHATKKDVTDLTVIRLNLNEYQRQCEEKYVTAAGNLPAWVGRQAETVDSLNLLLVNCEQAGEGIDCVKSYLKALGDSERKTLNGPALCTIHVSKGLEWPNVYVIGPCQSPLAVTEEQLYAEKCLEFVAYSRSSENVTIVTLEKAGEAEQ